MHSELPNEEWPRREDREEKRTFRSALFTLFFWICVVMSIAVTLRGLWGYGASLVSALKI